jgi:hypothetical protein
MQYLVNGQKESVATCSGTLVSATTLLTARHCVKSPEATSLFPAGYVFPPGDLKVQWGTNPDENDEFYNVVSHEVHPAADIAVLELEKAGPAAPVPMNTGALDAQIGGTVRLAGYGITASGASDSGIKRTGQSTLLDLESGGAEFGELAITGLEAGQPISKLCSGDSGGPTFMTIGGTEVIIGVNSFVARPAGVPGSGPPLCQDTNTINGEVRVDTYHSWITQFIEDTGGKLQESNTGNLNPDNAVTGGGCSSGNSQGTLVVFVVSVVFALALRLPRRRRA